MFQPDKSHLHHRLLRLGLDHRNVVLLLYGATVLLGGLALSTVFVKDYKAFVFLALLGVGLFWAFRKIGYLEYLAVDKIGGYLYDMGDLMGVTSQRRTFLDRQIEIDGAQDYETLWQHTLSALELLKIDQAELRINGRVWTTTTSGGQTSEGQVFKISVFPEAANDTSGNGEYRAGSAAGGDECGGGQREAGNAAVGDGGCEVGSGGDDIDGGGGQGEIRGNGRILVDERRQNLGRAARRDFVRTCTSCDLGGVRAVRGTAAASDNRGRNLVISLPLVNGDGRKCYGILYLEKDITRDPLAPFTLRRMEHLRRSLTAALKRLE